jgi:hypothetical protein
MPEDEYRCPPGALKFARREDAESPGGPLEKRVILTGKDHEVKICQACGYYHIVEVKDV